MNITDKKLWHMRDGRIDNGIVQKKEKNEKIIIKRENTTNPNVKEKLKKDEEKKR